MTTIQQLQLTRFKGFQNFTLELDKFTALVGRNGAGKTSLLEALYTVQLALRTIFGGKETPQFAQGGVPPTIGLSSVLRFGVTASQSEALWFERQLSDDLKIRATYTNGFSFEVQSYQANMLATRIFKAGSDRPISQLTSEDKYAVQSMYALRPELLRPVGAFLQPETRLPYDRMQSQLVEGHFNSVWRNLVWWRYDGDKKGFRTAVARLHQRLSWADVAEPSVSQADDTVKINYREDGIEYDVSSGGGGLATLLSVAVATELAGARLILLDEPDAHLHSSLQTEVARGLLQMPEQGQCQIVVATHAADFIDAVPVECVRWIDRIECSATRTTSATRVLERLGSLTKVQALQMRNVRVILWLEGESDRRVLEAVARKANREGLLGNPAVELAFGLKSRDDNYVVGQQELLSRVLGREVRIVALHDLDYRRLIEQGERKPEEKGNEKARSYILAKKEIENYFLDANAISESYKRALAVKQPAASAGVPGSEEVRSALLDWAKSADVLAQLRAKYIDESIRSYPSDWSRDRKIQEAERVFGSLVEGERWLLDRVPGKEALRFLNSHFSQPTGVELSAVDICEKIEPPGDLVKVLEALEEALRAVEGA